jgi:hypothetical protein
MMPEIIVPNSILFVQNLSHDVTEMLFCQYPGFKEVRMIEAKPGIAFVEYGVLKCISKLYWPFPSARIFDCVG